MQVIISSNNTCSVSLGKNMLLPSFKFSFNLQIVIFLNKIRPFSWLPLLSRPLGEVTLWTQVIIMFHHTGSVSLCKNIFLPSFKVSINMKVVISSDNSGSLTSNPFMLCSFREISLLYHVVFSSHDISPLSL